MSKNIIDIKKASLKFKYNSFDRTKRQILVDVSLFVYFDLNTGIQRVIKSQINELKKNAPNNYIIEPVYLKCVNKKCEYFYAKEFFNSKKHKKISPKKDQIITLKKGDIFYGLDLVARNVQKAVNQGIYQDFKTLGVKIVFLVYDLIAVKNPSFFPNGEDELYKNWIKNITSISDLLICISNSVKSDLEDFIEKNNLRKPLVKYLHLGADLIKNSAKRGTFKKPTFLMVSTLEPRKGHIYIIKAFEILWQKYDINLVLIGREGWMVDDLIEYINSHKEKNKRLFYLKRIDDETLINYYLNSTALILASFDEGFGLPLIEAANFDLPIIARDIPVFKEIAQNNAFYFKNTTNPKEIAKYIENWLQLYKLNKHPKSKDIKYFTWQENALKLFEIFKNL